MTPNDLKKGETVLLRNGWEARLEDSKKGNVRLCTVYGFETEMGSVYAHDIIAVRVYPEDEGKAPYWLDLSLTKNMSNLRNTLEHLRAA